MGSGRYAFGDSDLAAYRLELLGDVFEKPSRRFLETAAPTDPAVALDLGCGIGRTTRLVAEVTGAGRTIGLDTSEAFLARARLDAPRDVEFRSHDATGVPLPGAPADVIYARLLLAHLPEPVRHLHAWAGQLAPGGRLLLDEVEFIDAEDASLARYERIVTDVVATRGASMRAGPVIADVELGSGWRRSSDRVEIWHVPEPVAARMFALNLATWRNDPYVTENFTAAEVDALAASLDAVAASSSSPRSVRWGLRQLAFERVA